MGIVGKGGGMMLPRNLTEPEHALIAGALCGSFLASVVWVMFLAVMLSVGGPCLAP